MKITLDKYFREKDLENAYAMSSEFIKGMDLNFKKYVTDKQTFSTMFKIAKGTLYDLAAPYMDQDGTTAEVDNGSLEYFVGEFDAIGNNKKMPQSRYNELERNNALDQAIIEMFDRTTRAVNSNLMRLEDIFLQTLSRTKISLKALTNNASGIDKAVDYKVSSSQKAGATVKWSTSATATPYTDMKNFVNTQKKAGLRFEKVLMTDATIQNLLKSKEIIDLDIRNNGDLDSNSVSLNKFNSFLSLEGLPVIEEIIDNVKFANKKGLIDNTQSSWKEDNIVFISGSKFGQRLWMDPTSERKAARDGAGTFNMIDKMAVLDTVDSTDPISFKVMVKFYGTILIPELYNFGFMSTEGTSFTS